MRLSDSRYEFESTGRTFYANGYIGAVADEEGVIHIAQGYDGYITPETGDFDKDYDNDTLTNEEVIELSDYMINIWAEFKKQAQENQNP